MPQNELHLQITQRYSVNFDIQKVIRVKRQDLTSKFGRNNNKKGVNNMLADRLVIYDNAVCIYSSSGIDDRARN
ncbi:hypothetical protein CGJ61_09070 [Vibrio parahaemolyticus]|nr:hypothetical protein CGJ61_09070 [Vibrio parahaemolyticus]